MVAHYATTPMVEVEDDCIAAAVAGDRRAIEVVLFELVPWVRNLVRYLVRGDVEVEDIAQEALLAVVRDLPSYHGDGAFHGWVGRVVARITFRCMRRQRTRKKNAQMHEQMHEDQAGLAAVEGADVYLERRRFVALLDELSPEQRYAVVLHYVLEMSVPEVAAELRAPVETVRSRLRLARARLRGLGIAEGSEPGGES